MEAAKVEGGAEMTPTVGRLVQVAAFCLVLELIPASIAPRVTQALSTPMIGIGAGSACDGQILVQSDVLGLSGRKPLKKAPPYADLHKDCVPALECHAREARERKFPGPEDVPEE